MLFAIRGIQVKNPPFYKNPPLLVPNLKQGGDSYLNPFRDFEILGLIGRRPKFFWEFN